jgi:hypothetical protein
MTDRQRILQWVAILGLVTAGLALGTQAISLINGLKSDRDNLIEQNQRLEELVNTVRSEAKKQIEVEREDRRQELADKRMSDQQAAACQQHTDVLSHNEAQFSDLANEHGTMIRAMNSCLKTRDAGAGLTCAAIVCAFGGGQVCIDAVLRAQQTRKTIELTRAAAESDGCIVPTSPTLQFFAQ